MVFSSTESHPPKAWDAARTAVKTGQAQGGHGQRPAVWPSLPVPVYPARLLSWMPQAIVYNPSIRLCSRKNVG